MKLPPTIAEVATPTTECPAPERWHCFDGLGTELEVLELLESLVAALKPKVIVETGTYLGYGTYFLALGAASYGGHVHSAEPNAAHVEKANELLNGAEWSAPRHATIYNCTGEYLINALLPPIDFAFLDSDGNTRIYEMKVLLPKLSPGGVVAVHDSNTYHDKHSGIRSQFMTYALINNMQIFNLDTPRGLCLLRKGVK